MTHKAALEDAAALLRAAGWAVTPPPPAPLAAPRVGMRVRYLRSKEWGPNAGDVGTIIELRKADRGCRAASPIFWVRPDNWPTASIWTEPADVEALPDA